MRVELNGLGELHIYSESELETYALTQWSEDNFHVSEVDNLIETGNIVVHLIRISDESRIPE